MSHKDICYTPGTFRRKEGEVWCCPTCSKLWTLRHVYYWLDRYKIWEPIEKDSEQQ